MSIGHEPGWWLAADGRYYPPSDHPDPEHRARFRSTDDDEPGGKGAGEGGLGEGSPADGSDPTLPEVPIVADSVTLPDVPAVTDTTPIPVVVQELHLPPPAPGTVQYAHLPPPPTGPVVHLPDAPPVDVPVPPPPPAGAIPPPHAPVPGIPTVVPMPPVQGPPSAWPEIPPSPPRKRPSNVSAAVAGSIGALLACVGAFLPWIEAESSAVSVERSGWDLGVDGRIVLIAGLVVAAVAGACWAGARHILFRLAFLAGAAALLAVFVADALDVLDLRDTVPGVAVRVGGGLWMVGAAGVVLVAATVLERSAIRR